MTVEKRCDYDDTNDNIYLISNKIIRFIVSHIISVVKEQADTF